MVVLFDNIAIVETQVIVSKDVSDAIDNLPIPRRLTTPQGNSGTCGFCISSIVLMKYSASQISSECVELEDNNMLH